MRALTKRRVAFGLLASAAVSGALAVVGVPAYGQSAGVGNSGGASASTGGNSSTGNASTNVAEQSTTATTAPPSVLGSLLGVVLNLSTQSTNQSNGSSTVGTGAAQASGNNSDTSVGQASAGGGVLGTVFSPFVTPSQNASVSNSGEADASTGGNTGTGNASTNVASNTQNVSGGLIAIGLTLGSTASNVSDGTSVINTGPASAAGNTATNTVDQTRVGGGPGGIGGPHHGIGGGHFRIGSGVACDGLFGFGGQRVEVSNRGAANASTGGNESVGNASTNSASNEFVGGGGLINLNVPGLLGVNSSNVSDGSSAIGTGAAAASGNQSTTAVTQQCVEPVAFHGPPVITPRVVHLDKAVVPVVQHQQLARTGVDPFVLGIVAFALLFGGLLFLVWERVESYPTGARPAA